MLNKHMLERKSLDIKGEVLDKEDVQELITFIVPSSLECVCLELFRIFEHHSLRMR